MLPAIHRAAKKEPWRRNLWPLSFDRHIIPHSGDDKNSPAPRLQPCRVSCDEVRRVSVEMFRKSRVGTVCGRHINHLFSRHRCPQRSLHEERHFRLGYSTKTVFTSSHKKLGNFEAPKHLINTFEVCVAQTRLEISSVTPHGPAPARLKSIVGVICACLQPCFARTPHLVVFQSMTLTWACRRRKRSQRRSAARHASFAVSRVASVEFPAHQRS